MPAHLRRCVECPKCLTRYLIGFSPYENGSYLLSPVPGGSEEYTLYCAGCSPAVPQWWRWSEMKTYSVARSAHERGYGTCDEIVPVPEGRVRVRPIDANRLQDSNEVRHKKLSP